MPEHGDSGQRSADLLLEGEKRPTLGCRALGDAVLERLDRKQAGIAAPAHGLALVRVTYPEEAGIPPANADTPLINVYDAAL